MRSEAEQFGFTMVELIVVIAMIGILAAIGVPMLSSNIRTAKNTDAQNTLRTIYLMQKNYFAENFCYFVNSGAGDMTSSINQVLLGSSTPASGPIGTGSANDFMFYILPGAMGSGGSCTGSLANDYVAYAKSKTNAALIYSINQRNVKSGF
jgi:prepilin-type N-terminal cleavage/methylation domain-containing protein